MKIADDSPPILSALDRPNSYIGRSVPRPNLARLTQGRLALDLPGQQPHAQRGCATAPQMLFSGMTTTTTTDSTMTLEPPSDHASRNDQYKKQFASGNFSGAPAMKAKESLRSRENSSGPSDQ